MATLADAKTIGGGFSNAGELVHVTYDFAVDGGEVEDNILLTASNDCLVEFVCIDVKTAVTSGGSLVMDLGKGAGGTQFLSDKAVAALTLDAIIGPDSVATKMVELSAAETIQMGIEAAAATAGKVKYSFRIYARN